MSNFTKEIIETYEKEYKIAEDSDGVEIEDGKHLMLVKNAKVDRAYLDMPTATGWMKVHTDKGKFKTRVKTHLFKDSSGRIQVDMIFLPLTHIFPWTGDVRDLFISRHAFLDLAKGRYFDFVVHREYYEHNGISTDYHLIVKILPCKAVMDAKKGVTHYYRNITQSVYENLKDIANTELTTGRLV